MANGIDRMADRLTPYPFIIVPDEEAVTEARVRWSKWGADELKKETSIC